MIGITVGLQSTVFLLIGLLVGRGLYRQGARLRSLLYRITMLGTLGVMFLSACGARPLLPLWEVSLPPTIGVARPPSGRWEGVPQRREVERTAAIARTRRGGEQHEPLRRWERQPLATSVTPIAVTPLRAVNAAPAQRSWLPTLAAGIVGIWMIGAFALLLRLALSSLYLVQLRRQAQPFSDGSIRNLLQILCEAMSVRPPLLLVSAQVHSPLLTGLFRPAILLPVDFTHASAGNNCGRCSLMNSPISAGGTVAGICWRRQCVPSGGCIPGSGTCATAWKRPVRRRVIRR